MTHDNLIGYASCFARWPVRAVAATSKILGLALLAWTLIPTASTTAADHVVICCQQNRLYHLPAELARDSGTYTPQDDWWVRWRRENAMNVTAIDSALVASLPAAMEELGLSSHTANVLRALSNHTSRVPADSIGRGLSVRAGETRFSSGSGDPAVRYVVTDMHDEPVRVVGPSGTQRDRAAAATFPIQPTNSASSGTKTNLLYLLILISAALLAWTLRRLMRVHEAGDYLRAAVPRIRKRVDAWMRQRALRALASRPSPAVVASASRVAAGDSSEQQILLQIIRENVQLRGQAT